MKHQPKPRWVRFAIILLVLIMPAAPLLSSFISASPTTIASTDHMEAGFLPFPQKYAHVEGAVPAPPYSGDCLFSECIDSKGIAWFCIIGWKPDLKGADCKQVDSDYTQMDSVDLSNTGITLPGAGALAAAASAFAEGGPGSGCPAIIAAIDYAANDGESVDQGSLLGACSAGWEAYNLGVKIGGGDVPDSAALMGAILVLPLAVQPTLASAAVAMAVGCGYVNYYCKMSDFIANLMAHNDLQSKPIPIPILPQVFGVVNWGDFVGWAKISCLLPAYGALGLNGPVTLTDSKGVTCGATSADAKSVDPVPGSAGHNNGDAKKECATGQIEGMSIGFDGDVSFDISDASDSIKPFVNPHNDLPGPGGSAAPNGLDVEIPLADRGKFPAVQNNQLKKGKWVNVCGYWVADLHQFWNELHPVTSLAIVNPVAFTTSVATSTYTDPSFPTPTNTYTAINTRTLVCPTDYFYTCTTGHSISVTFTQSGTNTEWSTITTTFTYYTTFLTTTYVEIAYQIIVGSATSTATGSTTYTALVTEHSPYTQQGSTTFTTTQTYNGSLTVTRTAVGGGTSTVTLTTTAASPVTLTTTNSSESTSVTCLTPSGCFTQTFTGNQTVILTTNEPLTLFVTQTETSSSNATYTSTLQAFGTSTLTITNSTGGVYTSTFTTPITLTFMTPGTTTLASSTSTSASPSTAAPSGCVLATAISGSELAPLAQSLRGFRDNAIQKTRAGSQFMIAFNAWYYSFSPYIAYYIATHPVERTLVKDMSYPLIGILYGAYYSYAIVAPLSTEAAAVTAGIIAASLIGLVYVAPIACLTMRIVPRGKRPFRFRGPHATLPTVWFASSLAIMAASYAAGFGILMVIGAASLTLSALSLGSVLGAVALMRVQLPIDYVKLSLSRQVRTRMLSD